MTKDEYHTALYCLALDKVLGRNPADIQRDLEALNAELQHDADSKSCPLDT